MEERRGGGRLGDGEKVEWKKVRRNFRDGEGKRE